MEEEKKTKKSSVLLFFVLVVIVLVAAGGYYFLKINTARYIFDKKISQLLSVNTEITKFKTMKSTADVSIKIDSDDEDLDEISDLINKSKLTITTEIDNESSEEVVGLKLKQSKETILDAKVKIEEDTQKMYLNLGDLFDKTIKMDLDELDEDVDISNTGISSIGQLLDAKKAQQILIKEFQTQLKDEYFSTENVTVDGKNLTKNELKFTQKEFIKFVKTILEDLSKNDEFLSCYENKDELKEILEDSVDSIDEDDFYDDMNIMIDIYTSGIMKTAEKVEFVFEEDDEKVVIELTENDGTYQYKIIENDEEIFNGEIKINIDGNNYTIEITAKDEDFKIELNISGNVVYDEEITDFNTKKAVDLYDLTTEDAMKLYNNFLESELYEIVENVSSSSNYYDDDYDYDDYTFDFEEEEEEDDDDDDERISKYLDNIVKTYDGDSIKFNIPEGYEIYSSDSESYKLFEKETRNGDIDVDVTVTYDTIDEYFESIVEKANRYGKEEQYQNIKLTDKENFEVNGNKFTKVTLSYDYVGYSTTPYVTTYIAYEINSEYLYTVEIDDSYNLMTNQELEAFLTIEK